MLHDVSVANLNLLCFSLTYRTIQNFGGRKFWWIWRIARDSPKFSRFKNCKLKTMQHSYISVKRCGWRSGVNTFSVKESKTTPTWSKWSTKYKNSLFSDFLCQRVCRQTTQFTADSFGDRGDKRNNNSRGPYTILMPAQKFEMGKRAVGYTAAMCYYAKKYPVKLVLHDAMHVMYVVSVSTWDREVRMS